MMFRLLATNGNVLLRKHQQGHQLTRLVTRGFKANAVVSSSTPNAQDVVVKLTFVDPNGARRKATGYVGTTLFDACEMHGIDLGPASTTAPPEMKRTENWMEPTFGEGVTSGFDHVVLAGKGASSAVRMTPTEQDMLEDYWDFDEIFDGSRLASSVVLTKEMDGMTVYIPDRVVDDVP